MNNFNDCEPVNMIEQMFTKEQFETYTTLQKQDVRLPDLWICNPDDMLSPTELNPDAFYDTKLEAIEAWASDEGLISDEDELNERYADMLLEVASLETLVQMQGDHPMISQDFSSYADNLVRDGELHVEQYHGYNYNVDISEIIQRKANQ